MRLALTRAVPPSIVRCELTHLERRPIDPARASAQHEAYEETLRRLGYIVVRLPDTPDLPDSVFVEDAALVLDELAVITRPGADSRRQETASVAEVLARYRPVHRLVAPATMDGGDVLRVGRDLYVGLSSRTDGEGARQLADAVGRFGYTVRTVSVTGCLHLKSAVTAIADDLLIGNPAWIDPAAFDGRQMLAVPPAEPFAANVLRAGNALLCAAEYARTADLLRARGYEVHQVDVSELAKAEAGVTCCSLVLE